MIDGSTTNCPVAARAQHDGAVERLAKALKELSGIDVRVEQLPAREMFARTALHHDGKAVAVVETSLEGHGFTTRTLPPV